MRLFYNPTMETSSQYKKYTIIIGFAEALSAPEVVWSLVDNSFDVVVFSRRGSNSPLRRSKKIKISEVCPPETNVTHTISDLKNIINCFTPNIIMPLDDRAVWICDKIAASVNTKNAGPIGMQADLALDKRLQIDAAERAGLRIIPTHNVSNPEDLSKINDFPVLLKPAISIVEADQKLISGRHYRCTSKSELMNVTKTWTGTYPMVAQPIISGIGEGIFGLSTDTGVKAWSAHRRIRMMNPLGSGSSACASVQITDQPIDLLERMFTETNWRGIFMVEMLRDTQNQLWFMEMNGRCWGSMALARRRGYEYPLWSILYTLDPLFQPPIPAIYKDIVCRHLGREIIHILMVLRGPQSSAVSSWPSLGRTILDVLRIKRNHAWYNWHKGETLFFIEDTYRTVSNILKKKFRPG